MCGRVNIHNPSAINQVLDTLGLPALSARGPRYNVTPGSPVDVLFDGDQLAMMDWGIEFGKFRHPNTKAETIRRKPFLQKLLVEQRCIVPVNRFYEWPDAERRPRYKGIKTRFSIHTPADVMFLGGIFQVSRDGVMQFNVITTDPNPAINEFHHRMPVIVEPAALASWFGATRTTDLYGMLAPYTGAMNIYECSRYVDNGRNEGPRCIEPRAGQQGEGDSR